MNEIDKIKDQLLEENKELKQKLVEAAKIEKSLNSINHQFSASEQQLRAANQQLDASSQQLLANEQQLRAANQQLEANNQQLIVREQQLLASEKVLQKEKNFSESLLETTNSFVVVLDVNANITLFNAHAEELTDYKKEEVLGKNWFDYFISKSSGNEIPEVFYKLLKKMPKYSSYENPIVCKNGTEKLLSWGNTVLRNDNNKILGILSIGQDITEQKKSQEKLKENKYFIDSIFESVKDGISVLNPDLTVTHVNKTMSDWHKENLPLEGKKCYEVYHNSNRPCEPCPVLRSLKTGKAESEIVQGISGSSIEWLDIHVYPIKNKETNEITGVAEFVRNITEKKNAEKNLVESEKRFKNLSNLTLEGLVIHKDGIAIDTNKAFLNLFGYTREEIVGKNIIELCIPDKKYQSIIQENILLNKTEPYEIEGRKKDGTLISVELEARNIEYEGKEIRVVAVRDLTERKKAAEQISDSLHQMEMINANTPNIIWKSEIDKDGNFINTYISEVVDEFLGVPSGTINNSWEQYFAYVLPQYIAEINDLFKAGITNPGKMISFDYEVKKANGDIAWFSSKGHALVQNNILTLYGSTIDTTDRKKSEEELTKLSVAVDQSPTVIMITDSEGKIEYVNPKFTELTGYTYQESIGQTPSILKLGMHSNEIYKELWEKIRTGSDWQGEFYNKKKNGARFWESALISPIVDKQGKITNYIKIAEDITENKLAKEMLVKNEKKLRDLFNNLDSGIVTHAPDTSIRAINAKASELLGLSEEQLLGKQAIDPNWHCMDENNQPLPFENYPVNQVLNDKKAIKNVVVGVYHAKTNNITWLIVNGLPVLNNQNEITEIIISFIDNTKRIESEIKLKSALKKATESDRLKSAFLANMSHEIRTPMNGILGFSELLKEPGLSGNEQQEYIKIIEKSGVRMLNTINDIIDISRIESGQVDVKVSEVNVNKEIEYLHTFFSPEAEKKGLEFSFKTELIKREAIIKTDRVKFLSILTNLIKNAIKYSHQGSIEFGYSLQTNGDSSEIEFYIKDTGIGIPKDRLQAIFNRFEQADIEDTDVYEGSGLGLAISKAYVEMLGGEIGVESEEGVGSEFHFTIPFKNNKEEDANANGNVKHSARVESQNKKLNILIVEDEEVAIQYLTIALKDFGKEFIHAKTGTEAIDACRNNSDIDLILMDIRLPGMYGYEVTRKIRESNKDVVIIAQTAFGLSGDKEKALEAGCNDYISKPIRKDLLIELITKYFV